MKLDKAIKDLQARVDGEFGIKGVDDCGDMKLAIEALKARLQLKQLYPHMPWQPLPGED